MKFTAYFLSQQYEKLAELGDRLGEIEKMIDWEVFRPILSEIYQDDPLYGGRPHTDENHSSQTFNPATMVWFIRL